jgi:molybdopterin converting factor small subunit
MQPFTERSPESGDQPDANVYSNVRMTVQEAAAALGITVEAVRGRMHRGKYGREKTEDGRVYVVLTPDQLPNSRERFADRSASAQATVHPESEERSDERSSTVREHSGEREDLVEDLRDHIAFLRAELEARNEEIRRREEEHREEARRKDTIIAQLTQRIPELEAPSKPQEDHVTAPESPTASREPSLSDEGETYGTSPQEAEESLHRPRKRSWWRAFFGLE